MQRNKIFFHTPWGGSQAYFVQPQDSTQREQNVDLEISRCIEASLIVYSYTIRVVETVIFGIRRWGAC